MLPGKRQFQRMLVEIEGRWLLKKKQCHTRAARRKSYHAGFMSFSDSSYYSILLDADGIASAVLVNEAVNHKKIRTVKGFHLSGLRVST